MKDVLNDIVAFKRKEVAESKSVLPMRQLMMLTEQTLSTPVASMKKALMDSSTGIIAEFKRKSPSRGWINQQAKPADVTLAYQRAGAASISILTDAHFFGGYDEYIQQARFSGVTIPILYKNFIIDEYQLLQARYCGASAVLLIAACLGKGECRSLCHTAHELGLEVLLEMHDKSEVQYADVEPDMCGVNNRNLGTFITDVNNSYAMSELLPSNACKVSESGIKDASTMRELRKLGYNGFLMGERFMSTDNPGRSLTEMIAELQNS